MSLSDHFATYFELDFARTPEQLEMVQRLRYEVYCREFKFEREEDCPGGLEQDEFDANAIHCLAWHRASGQPASCVRVVVPPLDNPMAPLPLERYCGQSLHRDIELHPARTPRATICEISRLAAHPYFRRRRGESQTRIGAVDLSRIEHSEQEMRTFPLVSVAMICASPAVALLLGRPHMFIMIEKWLAVLLRRLGIPLQQIGEPTDYHGERTAYYIRAEDIVAGFKDDTQHLYELVHASLAENISRRGLGNAT